MSEKALACAVILQAVEDYQRPELRKINRAGKVSATWNEWNRQFGEAKRFLTDRSGEWAKSRVQWCNLAEIEPESLFERVSRGLPKAA